MHQETSELVEIGMVCLNILPTFLPRAGFLNGMWGLVGYLLHVLSRAD